MKKYMCTILALCSILLINMSCAEKPDLNDPFVKAEMEWRKNRDERMKKPTSWLTIAGLYWLEKGENKFGSDEKNNIILPAHSATSFMGTLILDDGVVSLAVDQNTKILLNGKKAVSQKLKTDMDENRDVMAVGDLQFWIIKRGDRFALRLRDLTAKRYREYHGIDYYPINKDYKVTAELVPYDKPKNEIIPTVVGTEEEYTIPGYLKFNLLGREMKLDPFVVESDSTVFFLIIKDKTSGKTTYGAARYMYPEIVGEGKVLLNFNRAYNPPCAFTPFATCPLPPEQNIMDIAIEAGEKKYNKNH